MMTCHMFPYTQQKVNTSDNIGLKAWKSFIVGYKVNNHKTYNSQRNRNGTIFCKNFIQGMLQWEWHCFPTFLAICFSNFSSRQYFHDITKHCIIIRRAEINIYCLEYSPHLALLTTELWPHLSLTGHSLLKYFHWTLNSASEMSIRKHQFYQSI